MTIRLFREPANSRIADFFRPLAGMKFPVKAPHLALLLGTLIMAACQTASQLSPTPLPPATPLPPQPPVGSSPGDLAPPLAAVRPPTPLPPPPTPRPQPTPIQLTGFDWASVAYREYWPTDLSGDLSVGVGGEGIDRSDWGVILVNVRDGDKRRITEGGHDPREVVISGDYIAWSDQSRQVEIPGSTAENSAGRLSVDIFLMDLSTGEERRITDVPARRHSLSIDGNMLVWQDNRNEVGEHRSHFDIYAYDIEADEEIAVVVAPGAQRSPSISGDRVVWLDESDDTVRVMLHDFANDETRVIDDSTEPKLPPDIHSDNVVWRGYDENDDHAVYLYDLSSGQRSLIASPGRGSTDGPQISDRYVVWTEEWPCDVFSNIMPDGMGVYVYDLEDGEVTKISNHVEPDAFIEENTLLVHEGCHFPWRVYVVFLE